MRGGSTAHPLERLCVAVLATNAAGQVLLVHSAKPGRAWELPGGKVDPGEAPREAACREVYQETGLMVALSVEEPIELRILVYRARAGGDPTPGSDASAARWLSWADVERLSYYDNLSDLASRDVLLAWARESRPKEAPRPRVGSWIGDDELTTTYDDRGIIIASVVRSGTDRYVWSASRAFLEPRHGNAPTRIEAMAAARDVLATWADVSALDTAEAP